MNVSHQQKSTRGWILILPRKWLVVLLVVLLAFTLGGAWIDSRIHRARTNRERGLSEILELGGLAKKEYHQRRNPTWLEELFDDPGSADDPVSDFIIASVDFNSANITDDNLKKLRGLKNVQELDLSNNRISDTGLKHLMEFTKLRVLLLDGDIDITDAGLAHLIELTNLEFLALRGTNITDSGLERLNGMSKLKVLILWDTKITDTGLVHLKGLQRLEHLALDGTNVTDAGSKHLKGMTNLESLSLYRTRITDEGVDELRRALPNCKITR